MKIIFAFLLSTVLFEAITTEARRNPSANARSLEGRNGGEPSKRSSPGGLDAIIDTKPLANGIAKLKTPATGNSVSVTVRDESGRQLAKFPMHLVMANSQRIQRSEVQLVFSKASKSLKSAQSRWAFGSNRTAASVDGTSRRGVSRARLKADG